MTGGGPEPLSRESARRLVNALNARFQGLQREIEAFVLAHIAGMPVLLIGPHGSGKTRLTKAFYSMLWVGDRPVKTFSLMLKEKHTINDVFYRYDLPALMRGEEKIIPLAVDAEAVFLDEIFANLQVLSALKDFLEEKIIDRFAAKWLFFTGATNPRNSFYETLLNLQNYADMDRFGACIVVPNRVGLRIAGIVHDMSRGANGGPAGGVRVDVSNIEKVRQEIAAVPVSPEATAFLSLLCHSLTVCYFEDARNSNVRARIDKFMCLRELPCRHCRYGQNDRHFCGRYAASPNRLARSTLLLAKALAWLRGDAEATREHVVRALRFTLPHRLYVVDERLLEQCPSMDAAARRCLEDFTTLLATWKGRGWLRKLSEACRDALCVRRSRTLDQIKNEAREDPIMLSFAEDLENTISAAVERLQALLPQVSDQALLREMRGKADPSLWPLVDERLRAVRGTVTVTTRDPEKAAKLLKALIMAGAQIDERNFEALCIAVKDGASWYCSGEGFDVGVQGGVMTVSADGELGKAIKPFAEEAAGA